MFGHTLDWFEERDASMKLARKIRSMNKSKQAVEFWVSRARRYHRVGMRFEPYIKNFVYVGNNIAVQGDLYGK